MSDMTFQSVNAQRLINKILNKLRGNPPMTEPQPMTRLEIEIEFCLSIRTANKYLRYMHDQKLIHIGRFRAREGARLHHPAEYCYGPGEDAIPPAALSINELKRRSLEKCKRRKTGNPKAVPAPEMRPVEFKPFRNAFDCLFFGNPNE